MKHLPFLMLVFIANFAFAQNEIQGTVVDNQSVPLPGANVTIQGVGSGESTDFDGEFTLKTDQTSGNLQISYVGFQTKVIPFDFENEQVINLGDIELTNDADALGEVKIIGKGVVDLEEDRETPIAVSTITRDEIQVRAAGNVEFPNILKNTPSVYVSNESGGFGDSEAYVRGFDQSNTAFLVNGQPVNGMTNGKIYWSNWSGLSDIVNAVQIQRGLGSSKLAISSVGGTVNMVTKATERNQGGSARLLTGNDGYLKGTVSYDTGVNDKGWGFSFLLDYWRADRKYARGTQGEGQNYFFSVGKEAGDHNFNFLITGAPQWHDQNYSKASDTKNDFDDIDNTDPLNIYKQYGRRYNNNYGFRDGDRVSQVRNYYHKPIMNLNWDWAIDEGQSLSTVLYASFGRGGGTNDYGNGVDHIDNGYAQDDYKDPNFYDFTGAYVPETGLIDWDHIVDENKKIEDGFSEGYDGTMLKSAANNHQWYGGVMNYEYKKIKNLNINVGADIRFYDGDHFEQLTDLLGLKGRKEELYGNPDYQVTKTFNPDPWSSLFNFAKEGERVNYDYSEQINYQGGFGQVEWANDKFSVFLQGALSNQSYKKTDRGNFEKTKKSESLNKTGYNIKGGASWKFLEGNSLFVNAGKYSRQPHLNNIFTNYSDETEITEDEVHNENITGLEFGYRYDTDGFQANVNAYYTTWDNRFLSAGGSDYEKDGEEYSSVSYLFSSIAQLHQGIELDVKWQPTTDWVIRGYTTFGKWRYNGETPVRVRDNNEQKVVDEMEINLKETKVGQSPQTTVGLGMDYDLIPTKLKVYGNWNYYTNFYGFVDVADAATEKVESDKVYQPEKLNSYSLFDIGASYNFDVGGEHFLVAGNIYNLFNHDYVGQKDNYGYYLGNGMTYNLSIKYMF